MRRCTARSGITMPIGIVFLSAGLLSPSIFSYIA
jgi:hypothetical protein